MMTIHWKIHIILILCVVAYILVINFPGIAASFDENKYVDGEVYLPVRGNEYDFKLFTLNSSISRNYTIIIAGSGYCQFLNDMGNNTINVLEWNKMNLSHRNNVNSSFEKEFVKPSHGTDGIRIIDIDFIGYPFYATNLTNEDGSITILHSNASENETLEMIRTFEFKEEFK